MVAKWTVDVDGRTTPPAAASTTTSTTPGSAGVGGLPGLGGARAAGEASGGASPCGATSQIVGGRRLRRRRLAGPARRDPPAGVLLRPRTPLDVDNRQVRYNQLWPDGAATLTEATVVAGLLERGMVAEQRPGPPSRRAGGRVVAELAAAVRRVRQAETEQVVAFSAATGLPYADDYGAVGRHRRGREDRTLEQLAEQLVAAREHEAEAEGVQRPGPRPGSRARHHPLERGTKDLEKIVHRARRRAVRRLAPRRGAHRQGGGPSCPPGGGGPKTWRGPSATRSPRSRGATPRSCALVGLSTDVRLCAQGGVN